MHLSHTRPLTHTSSYTHVLHSDEIYARSIWDDKVEYVSALEVAAQLSEQHPELADVRPGCMYSSRSCSNTRGSSQDLQKLVHVAWGLSKDVGATALRFGWLATHNEDVIDALLANNAGQSTVPTPVQNLVAAVISNSTAMQRLLDNSARRMRDTYKIIASACCFHST